MLIFTMEAYFDSISLVKESLILSKQDFQKLNVRPYETFITSTKTWR